MSTKGNHEHSELKAMGKELKSNLARHLLQIHHPNPIMRSRGKIWSPNQPKSKREILVAELEIGGRRPKFWLHEEK
jgi:hypothetical protein